MAVTLESLKKSIGKKKKSRLFVWLADLEREAGNLEGAIKILDEGLQEFPDMVHAHLVRSVILLEQGNTDGSLEACDSILKIHPTCLSALRRKGEIYETLGDEVSRNKYYRLVHDIDPLDMFWKEEYGIVPEEEVEEFAEEPLILPEDSADGEGFLIMPQDEEVEEDPFQMLNNIGQEEPTEEDSLSLALENSLNEVLESEGETEVNFETGTFEEDSVSGTDVSSAISDFFGAEDDFPEEAKPVSPFSNLEIPESLEDPEPVKLPEESSPFEKSVDSAVAEESVDLDGAFDSLLGEDELPEESSPFEKSVDSAVAEESVDLNGAFDSLLGEDELPEESSPFEKSVDSAVAEESVDLDGAFDSLLGEDELPKESSPFEKSVDSAVAEESVDLDGAFDSLLGEDELPEESSPFEKSVDSAVAEESVDLDGAFDSLLGEDELPEESSTFEKSRDASVETSADTLEDSDASGTLELPDDSETSLADLLKDSATMVKDETGVSDAFDSLFGTDDLPTENSSEEVKPLDELLEDDELTLPSVGADSFNLNSTKIEKNEVPSELSAEVSSSLDALFGDDDDDLELPSLSSEEPATAEKDVSEENTGAFDSLFSVDEADSEKISEEQDEVDFLMSGDSEDEVSQALLKDPAASLLDNGENIDESLNTATLAEIYFEQGLLQKSLDIYKDLSEKNPEDEHFKNRLNEIQQAFNEKFGDRE